MSNGIQWTWSPVTGCSRVSEGCRYCYAERLTATRLRHQPKYTRLAVLNGSGEARWTGEVRCHEDALHEPLHWRKPRRVFVDSMSDTFHERVPFEFIDRIFAVAALCPQHTFQILTKRPERMAEYLDGKSSDGWDRRHRVLHAMPRLVCGKWCFVSVEDWKRKGFPCPNSVEWPLPNVWLGTSCEDQATADARIPHLLRCPAAVRFLSLEPLLGPIELERWLVPVAGRDVDINGEAWRGGNQWHPIDWVIVGGESGKGARPCDVAWIRSIVGQCRSAGVPCFVKQWGSNPRKNGAIVSLADSKGGDMSQWPDKNLRVREYPS